jgi:Mrp family chromosome partitioning ATPase
MWVDSFDDTTLRIDPKSEAASQSHLQPANVPQTHAAYEAMGPMKANEFVARSESTSPTPTPTAKTPAPQPAKPAEFRASETESPEAVLSARISRALQQPPTRHKHVTDHRVDPAAHAAHVATAPNETPNVDPARFDDLHSVPAPTSYFNADQQTSGVSASDAPAPGDLRGDAVLPVTDADLTVSENLPQPVEVLRPNWEVEVFDVPTNVADLFFDEPLFQDLSVRLNDASQDGLRTMLMTSAMAGEGRTTVAIGVALAAASSGLRVALVDGDLATPSLVDELRLDLDHSWVESVRRGLPMKEIAVHAVEDNLTLIPLLPTDTGRQATTVECAQMIESLKPSFDLIIIDGPTADARDMRMLASAIDSVVIVHDVNQSGEGAADLLAARLQRSGIDGVGIVENFV